jgi:hypothetical protein
MSGPQTKKEYDWWMNLVEEAFEKEPPDEPGQTEKQD